jgi:hypothetical protein
MTDKPYREGVPSSLVGTGGGGGSGVTTDTRRRRPPSQLEQERRKAWGAKWGAIMRAAAREKGLGAKR